jgi:proline iminopeptidase
MSTNGTHSLRPLYPPIEPFETGFLEVSKGHKLYYEVSGNPLGEPLMFLHGGPGSGSSPDTRRLFDPKRFKTIQFDQRGCGRSTPHGSLEDNSTSHLVDDINDLIDHLDTGPLHLAGGSWGSTLALSYGIKHPQNLRSLLVYGVFLCRPEELRGLYFPGGIAQQIYPDLFDEFLSLLPEDDRHDPIWGYSKLFLSIDREMRDRALLMWTRLEKKLSMVDVDDNDLQTELKNADYVLSHSLIENFYFRYHCFVDLEGEHVLLTEAAYQLADIPVHIINGRYDLVCPLKTAYELHQALPHSTLTIVPMAGHSFREAGITDAIIRRAEELPGHTSN